MAYGAGCFEQPRQYVREFCAGRILHRGQVAFGVVDGVCKDMGGIAQLIYLTTRNDQFVVPQPQFDRTGASLIVLLATTLTTVQAGPTGNSQRRKGPPAPSTMPLPQLRGNVSFRHLDETSRSPIDQLGMRAPCRFGLVEAVCGRLAELAGGGRDEHIEQGQCAHMAVERADSSRAEHH